MESERQRRRKRVRKNIQIRRDFPLERWAYSGNSIRERKKDFSRHLYHEFLMEYRVEYLDIARYLPEPFNLLIGRSQPTHGIVYNMCASCLNLQRRSRSTKISCGNSLTNFTSAAAIGAPETRPGTPTARRKL